MVRSWSTWTTYRCRDLATARDVLVVTSTFGDGGPPDNGADFWNRLDSPDAPALDGIRYAVLGIGDRSYDNFCGHAKSIDTGSRISAPRRMLERTDCEIYDDEPMERWADRVTTLLAGAPVEPTAAHGAHRRPCDDRPPRHRAEPFTRAKPVLAPLCRNVVLTAPTSAKRGTPVRL